MSPASEAAASAAGEVHTVPSTGRPDTGVSDHDVVVVGAGPGGSTTAAYLAGLGLDVALLEKATFPRDKICGDGLTPRAVKELVRLGVDTSEEAGWVHNRGLRVYGGNGRPFTLDWPELADFPPYGMTRRRTELDELLARHAVSRGAHLVEGARVTEPLLHGGRIVGVRTRDGRTFRAPVVVAADGNSSRLAVAMGIRRAEKRPMGVAVRSYVTSPRHDGEYMESWLELWDGRPGESNLLPGYGWAFPMGDGTVNVGLGMLNTSPAFAKTDYRAMMRTWLENTPEEWGFRPENLQVPIKGMALPMAFNRKPHYKDGLLLVGDAGGMVNPFNGEGIDSAMQAGRIAAGVIVDAKSRGFGTASAERALTGYPLLMKDELGKYYRLGAVFARLIGNPTVMRIAVHYGLPRHTLMRLVHKLLAGLTDQRDGDAFDRVINTLVRIAPSV